MLLWGKRWGKDFDHHIPGRLPTSSIIGTLAPDVPAFLGQVFRLFKCWRTNHDLRWFTLGRIDDEQLR